MMNVHIHKSSTFGNVYFSERRWFYREPDALPQRKELNKRMKTHVKKKILAVFLSLCMAMSLLPVTALAAEGEETDDTVVAKVGDTTYSSLQTAIDNANGKTVTLQADVSANVTVSSGTTVTIDLNGFTIDGGTVQSSPALTNNGGTVTIQDSSEAQTGTIKRSDTSSTTSYYTVLNKSGTLTFKAGKVENNSGKNPPAWSGSSLICNGPNQEATLILNGGTFSQNNFIAIKNDEKGILEINEGAVVKSETQAVQNWCDATINGGTLEGDVTSWTYLSTSATTKISGGSITGELQAVKLTYNNTAATNKPIVEISGTPTITGTISVGHQVFNQDGSFVASNEDADITIQGGTFSAQPDSDFIPTGYAAVKDADAKTWTVKELGDNEMAVKPDTSEEGSVSATLEGTYGGADTTIASPDNVEADATASEGVVVDLSKADDDATSATLTVTKEAATSLTTAPSLTVNSAAGSVKLDSAALGELADVTAPVVISIEAKGAVDDAAPTWEVTVKEGEKELFAKTTDVGITITVPAPEDATADNTKVYCIDNGGMEDMNAELKDGNLTWTTKHLSTFAAVTLGEDDVATWTTKDDKTSSGSLAEALNAVATNGGTITLLKDATLENANYTIKGDVTITGTGTITATNPSTHAFTVKENTGSLTLNDVTLKITGDSGYGIDVQYGTTLTLNNAEIILEGVSNATISSWDDDTYPSDDPGKFILNNSKITATDIGGNFSNGGDWALTNSSIEIEDCASNGFSCNSATLDNSKVSVSGAQLMGVTAKEITLENDSAVTVKECGTGLPKDSIWATDGESYKHPVEIKKEGKVTIDSTSSMVLQNNANNNTIYFVESTMDNKGTLQANVVTKAPDGSFSVTVKNGNSVLDVATVMSGRTYKLPAALSDYGYNHFVGWNDGSKTYDADTQVPITANTIFTAVWNYIPPANPNYRIDIPAAEGGTVTADPAAAKAGAKVTLTATPDEGYAVGTITVTDRFGDAVKVTENADGTYTFTMPNGQVTVKATFVETQEPAPAMPFTDVKEGDWFYDEVLYVYENGLMNGVGDNRFAPNSATTRGMLVTILYRLEGEPAVTGEADFSDVAAGQWYTDAVI